jgi:hypothetical protein
VAVVADGCKILALSVIKFEDFDAISCEKPVSVFRTRPGLWSAIQLVRGGGIPDLDRRRRSPVFRGLKRARVSFKALPVFWYVVQPGRSLLCDD